MAKLSRVAGTTSHTENIFIQDSTSTTGAGKTGLVYNSAGLTAYYVRPKATPVAISLATQTVTGAFSSGGFVEIDATNMPGMYRIDIPDAALASGADSVAIMLKGATGMAPCPLEIELTAWDNQDAVRGGLTALPNANASASGGLVTNGTSTGQISLSAGRVTANTDQLAGQTVTAAAGVTFPSSIASPTNITAGTITTTTNLTNLPSITAGWLTASGIAAGALNGKGDWSTYAGGDTAGTTTLLARIPATLTITAGKVDVNDKTGFSLTQTFPANFSALGINASGHITRVTLADTITTYTGDTPQTGDSFARIGAAGAGLTALGDTRIANLDAAVSSRSTYAGADTSGTTTLLSRVTGAVALASQIPADFTAGTFASAGVFSAGALANAPTGGGGGGLDAAGVRAAIGLASANLDTQLAALPTAAEIEDQVLDALLVDHNTTGTVGAGIGNASSAGDPWSTGLPGSYPTGTAGQILAKLITPEPETPVIVIPAPPADPADCAVYGYFQGVGHTTADGVAITFTLKPDTAIKGAKIITGRTVAASIVAGRLKDSAGNFFVVLERNDESTPFGSYWEVDCEAAGFVGRKFTLAVDTFDLASLIA